MGKGVIVVYRPKKGKENQLLKLVKDHVSILRTQALATDRDPVIMRSADGCIVEVFEWKSADAIERAHSNEVVQALWKQFAAVCDYEIPVNVAEFQNLFSEFEILNE